MDLLRWLELVFSSLLKPLNVPSLIVTSKRLSLLKLLNLVADLKESTPRGNKIFCDVVCSRLV